MATIQVSSLPKAPSLSDQIYNRSKELKLTQVEITREKNSWFWKKNVSDKEALVIKLTNQLVKMLDQLINENTRISKTRPKTKEEELEFVRIAKQFQSVYEAANQEGLADKARVLVKEAEEHVETIEKKEKKQATRLKRAEDLCTWRKYKSKYDNLRSYFPWLLYTNKSAEKEEIETRIQIAQENMQKNQGYPRLQKPFIANLAILKQNLLQDHLQPNTLKYFSTTREVEEHSDQVKWMETVEAAEDKIAGIENRIKAISSNDSESLYSLSLIHISEPTRPY